MTDPNGEETKFEYNAEGWQTKIIGPRGEETVFTHDAIGRVIQIDYPGGWQEIITYWEPGMIKSKKNKKGLDESAVNYEYDGVVRRMRSKLSGATESSSGSSVNPFGFVGQWGYYDDGARGSQSGLLLLGVRYYSPEFGRFWSWDAISRINLYCYSKNKPTFFVDPSGYDSVETTKGCCVDKFKLNPEINVSRDLLRCLINANQDKDEIEECFRKYVKGKISGKLIETFCNYLGCMTASLKIDLYDNNKKCYLDPCSLDRERFCIDCCWSKYYNCVCNAILSKKGLKIVNCQKSLTNCIAKCE